jgi:hypothetical protein
VAWVNGGPLAGLTVTNTPMDRAVPRGTGAVMGARTGARKTRAGVNAGLRTGVPELP